MAEAAISDEAEAAREAEEDRLAEEANEADAARKPKKNVLLDKQLSLPARLKRSVRQQKQKQKQPGRPRNSVLPLKLRRKLKRNP